MEPRAEELLRGWTRQRGGEVEGACLACVWSARALNPCTHRPMAAHSPPTPPPNVAVSQLFFPLFLHRGPGSPGSSPHLRYLTGGNSTCTQSRHYTILQCRALVSFGNFISVSCWWVFGVYHLWYYHSISNFFHGQKQPRV